jgi:hypothetical protein
MILLPIKQHENSQKPSLCNLQIFRPSSQEQSNFVSSGRVLAADTS